MIADVFLATLVAVSSPCDRGTTYDIRTCWSAKANAASDALTAAEARVRTQLRNSRPGLTLFEAAQRAWSSAMNQTCAFEYALYLPGTIAPQRGVECQFRMTQARTARLTAYLAALRRGGPPKSESPAAPEAASRLARVYRLYEAQLDAQQKAQFAAAQRAWENYRDRACALERGSCLTALTTERVSELEASWLGEPFW